MRLQNIKAREDFQAWDIYKNEYRYLFNKLEVALQQGLHAGPAGVPPQKDGVYVMRPVYNLYGMGIGAKKFVYDLSMADSIISHAVIPSGYFWCEWVDGPQLSIDFHRDSDTEIFYTRSVWQGVHYSEDNLTKFRQWIRLPSTVHPYDIKLNLPWNDPEVTAINVELRGDYVIEAHLRLSGDPFDDLPVGTIVTPVWDDMEILKGVEFRENPEEEGTSDGSAGGNLANVRKGYLIERPTEL